MLGTYLYYSQSKYCPPGFFRLSAVWSSKFALLLIVLATGLLIGTEGWASGLLIALFALSMTLMLIQLVAVLGKTYFYCLVGLIHGLLLIDLLY